jgi:hypothetical protein
MPNEQPVPVPDAIQAKIAAVIGRYPDDQLLRQAATRIVEVSDWAAELPPLLPHVEDQMRRLAEFYGHSDVDLRSEMEQEMRDILIRATPCEDVLHHFYRACMARLATEETQAILDDIIMHGSCDGDRLLLAGNDQCIAVNSATADDWDRFAALCERAINRLTPQSAAAVPFKPRGLPDGR